MLRTAEEIIVLIQERIAGCDYAERVATGQYREAKTEAVRDAAVTMSQIATGQRNVLQQILDEATGRDA